MPKLGRLLERLGIVFNRDQVHHAPATTSRGEVTEPSMYSRVGWMKSEVIADLCRKLMDWRSLAEHQELHDSLVGCRRW